MIRLDRGPNQASMTIRSASPVDGQPAIIVAPCRGRILIRWLTEDYWFAFAVARGQSEQWPVLASQPTARSAAGWMRIESQLPLWLPVEAGAYSVAAYLQSWWFPPSLPVSPVIAVWFNGDEP